MAYRPASHDPYEIFRRCQLENALDSLANKVLVESAKRGLQFRILICDPTLFEIPWEETRLDRESMGRIPSLTFVRIFPSSRGAIHRPGEFSILLVGANTPHPDFPTLPNLESEVTLIQNLLTEAMPSTVKVHVLLDATKVSLQGALKRHSPTFVHFAGHSTNRPSGWALVLGDGLYYGDEMTDQLASTGVRLFSSFSCESHAAMASLSRQAGIATIGYDGTFDDRHAMSVSRAFFTSIAAGDPVERAVALARMHFSVEGRDWAKLRLHQPSEEALVIAFRQPKLARNNIFIEPVPFVGRRQEFEEITQLLRSRSLVTLTGMGGIGKSRIAAEVGLSLQSDFRDGVWLIECENATSDLEVLEGIATALGKPFDGTSLESGFESTLATLTDHQVLLILDCFEGVAHQSTILPRLLRHVPKCKVLVTSRKPLSNSNDAEYQLRPLSIQPTNGEPSESAQLFVGAITSSGERTFQDADLETVEAIVTLLEGIPLAIMLAAGRHRYLSLADLLERLRQSPLKTLRDHRRDTHRHSGLERVIRDSVEMLNPRLRAALTQLATFRGSFSLDDGEGILHDEEAFSIISTLCDHSLVTSIDKKSRYRVLDSIRDYLLDQVDDPTRNIVRHRHAMLFANKAATLRNQMEQGKLSSAVELFWSDATNFRAAVRFATDSGDDELLSLFVENMARFVFEAGMSGDFFQFSVGVHGMKEPAERLLIEFMGLEGAYHKRQKDNLKCRETWERRVDLCRQIGDHTNEGDTLLDLADLMLHEGQLDEASGYLKAFDLISSEIRSEEIRISAVLLRAELQLKQNDLDGCRSFVTQAKSALPLIRDNRFTHFVFLKLCILYREIDDRDGCLSYGKRALVGAFERGYLQTVARSLWELSEAFDRWDRSDQRMLCLEALLAMPSEVSPQLQSLASECRQPIFTDSWEIQLGNLTSTL